MSQKRQAIVEMDLLAKEWARYLVEHREEVPKLRPDTNVLDFFDAPQSAVVKQLAEFQAGARVLCTQYRLDEFSTGMAMQALLWRHVSVFLDAASEEYAQAAEKAAPAIVLPPVPPVEPSR